MRRLVRFRPEYTRSIGRCTDYLCLACRVNFTYWPSGTPDPPVRGVIPIWTTAPPASGSANVATTISAKDDHWVVTGAKFYATGSLYADWLDVIGRGDDDQLWTALVGADAPGVTLVDDWKGFGQRTTASGSANYERLRADHGDVFPVSERFGYQPQFYQIAMLAVLTGRIRGF
jgi:alkylation response protein AidB-like acyl-CoA dehydrogenase